jgi:DNA replication protein DnaC
MTSNEPTWPGPRSRPRTAAEVFYEVGLNVSALAAVPSRESDVDDAAEWNRERAGTYFRTHAPAMFRHASASHPAVLDWVGRYLLDPAVAGSVALLGATGSGKTYQAYGALAAVGDSGRPPVRWVAKSVPDLYARLRPSSGINTEIEYEAVADAPLLLLDDLGAAKTSEWTEEITFRLIDRRYVQCLPTIVTTNLPLPKLRDILGDRVSSRLRQMCTMIAVKGDDRRGSA